MNKIRDGLIGLLALASPLMGQGSYQGEVSPTPNSQIVYSLNIAIDGAVPQHEVTLGVRDSNGNFFGYLDNVAGNLDSGSGMLYGKASLSDSVGFSEGEWVSFDDVRADFNDDGIFDASEILYSDGNVPFQYFTNDMTDIGDLNFTTIPGPATAVSLGIGALLLRRRKRQIKQ